jgi:hypothetical protein
MLSIFFKDKLIGELLNIDQDVDLWYSANINLSEYGKSLATFFAVLLNESSNDSDIDSLDPELLYDDAWYIIDSEEGELQVEIPAIYFEENIAKWRKK